MLDRIKRFGNTVVQELSEDPSEIIEMLEYLEASVIAACQMVNEQLAARGVVPDDSSSNKRLINYVFFDELDSDDDIDEILEDDDESLATEYSEGPLPDANHSDSDGNMNRNTAASTSRQSMPKPKMTSEELQKEQEEMLENEISQMAAQLKQSSLKMKSTLHSQNVDLDEMETLAQANLDKTKDVTDKVTEQVNAGWRKSFGRWMAFFIILGTWSFCFLTIRVMPKRKGACLFFCEETRERRDKHSRYDDTHSHEKERKPEFDKAGHGNQRKDANRKVDVKHSYCKESESDEDEGKQKQCTPPLDPHQHARKMNRFDNMHADDVAHMLAEEKRDRRFEMNLDRAQKEKDDVASRRVREGWDSGDDAEEDTGGDDNDSDHSTGTDYNEDDAQSEDATEDFTADEVDEPKIEFELIQLKRAITTNDIATVELIMKHNPEFVHVRDENGWEALHEAIRTGHLGIIGLLIVEGQANVNARIGRTGHGGSVLWVANSRYDSNHPVVKYLASMGAKQLDPEQRRRDEF